MKATDMAAKWIPELKQAAVKGPSEFSSTMCAAINEAMRDACGTIEARKVRCASALKSVFLEHNIKFNKFAKLVNADLGTTVFEKDTLVVCLYKMYKRKCGRGRAKGLQLDEAWFPIKLADDAMTNSEELQGLYNSLDFEGKGETE